MHSFFTNACRFDSCLTFPVANQSRTCYNIFIRTGRDPAVQILKKGNYL